MVMNIILGFMYIMMAVACILIAYWMIDSNYLLSDIWIAILGGISSIIVIIFLSLAINQFSIAYSDSDKSKQYSKEYPASEYRMSIKTTTMDNKTDTTYVITKIK